MLENLPPEMKNTLVGAIWAVLWGAIGRVMYHANQVTLGKRRFFTWQLVWELCIAMGMGVVAGGLADYLHLQDMVKAGFISAVAYLGPHLIEYGQTIIDKKVKKIK